MKKTIDELDSDTIIITSWTLDRNHEESFKMTNDDKFLNDAIEKYYKQILEPDDVEVFFKNKNIIVTEKGYFGAFYLKDLKDGEFLSDT